jgi:hypothetical protein
VNLVVRRTGTLNSSPPGKNTSPRVCRREVLIVGWPGSSCTIEQPLVWTVDFGQEDITWLMRQVIADPIRATNDLWHSVCSFGEPIRNYSSLMQSDLLRGQQSLLRLLVLVFLAPRCGVCLSGFQHLHHVGRSQRHSTHRLSRCIEYSGGNG